jgi:(1->4)-alpha-D-glucan 1-alpha-D-glucosylmutase
LYGEVLEGGQLKVGIERGGLFIYYYSAKFPVGPATYSQVLGLRPESRPDHPEFLLLLETLDRIPPRTAIYWEALESRAGDTQAAKQKLWEMYESDATVREFVDGNLQLINGTPGEPDSFRRLHALLESQPYRLAYWRVSAEKINYRRFFDVNELIGVRVDDPLVFDATHKLVLELIRDKTIDGVRVDHIDGLFDPQLYLDRLPHRETYVIVEKILADGEELPATWPVQGTSGYDFLGVVNALLVDAEGYGRVRDLYQRFTGSTATLADVEYGRKKRIITDLFAGEMHDLGLALATLAEADLYARDLSPRELSQALAEVTAALEIYRTYTNSPSVSERDTAYLEAAIREARKRAPSIGPAVFDFVRRVLLMHTPAHVSEDLFARWLRFVQRWQQITGPIMAKAVEDSTFYVYNPLISLNEVGAIHRPLSVAEWHAFCSARQSSYPAAMNGTSTHDTKRSEDARVRISVLSEIPDEWSRHVTRWSRWNREYRGEIDGNEEWFIYQTLLGVWPHLDSEMADFRDRLHEYFVKATREARTYSSWLEPNETHEEAVLAFVDRLLGDERWVADFRKLLERVEFYGAINALAQLLLKATAPGVPDFYQGTVGWNLSLVDPDNRRPFPFPQLTDFGATPPQLLERWRDGRIKVFATEGAVAFRKANHELFASGEYLPLETRGRRPSHVVAFARRLGDEWCIVVVPRLSARLSVTVRPPLGIRAWGDTEIVLPEGAPARWRRVLAGGRVVARDGRLAMARVLENFPVALLSARSSK